MTSKTFICDAPRCVDEEKAYDAAKDLAKTALETLRAARTAQIGAELAALGMRQGSPVIVSCRRWFSDSTERGVLRDWGHNGVVVAKRNKDGSAHATQNLYGVKSITLDEATE